MDEAAVVVAYDAGCATPAASDDVAEVMSLPRIAASGGGTVDACWLAITTALGRSAVDRSVEGPR